MIILTQIETELGCMTAGAVEEGICLLDFTDRKPYKTDYKTLSAWFGTTPREGESIHFIALRKELKEYFEGIRGDFNIPLVTPGTPFQQSVWNELLKIPFGSTRSYKEQANALNKPDSVRAVANANRMNRISIIIPCHRVIGSDGNLTGYAGGLNRKKWLLDHEKRHSGKSFESSLFNAELLNHNF